MGVKKCPYCFEEIQEEAILCKHCKSSLGFMQSKKEVSVSSTYDDYDDETSNNRTLEYVLGLIGGVAGLFSGVFAYYLGKSVEPIGLGLAGNLGLSALGFSILGLVGAFLVKKDGKLGGLFMTVAAIGGFICISTFYSIGALLLIVPGIMGLVKQGQEDVDTQWKIWIPVSLLLTILFIVPGFFGGDAKKTSTDYKDLNQVGTAFEAGGLTYKVEDVYKANKLGDKSSSQSAKGTYIIVQLSVTNNNKEVKKLDTSIFKLVQNKQTEYAADSNASKLLNKDNTLFSGALNPKSQQTGYMAFDVPTLDGEYILKLTPETGSTDYKYVLVPKGIGLQEFKNDKAPATESKDTSKEPPTKEEPKTKTDTSLSGKWRSSEYQFVITFTNTSDLTGTIVGSTKSGSMVDNGTFSAKKIDNAVYQVSWASGYSSAKGSANLTVNPDGSMSWEVTSVTEDGDYFYPDNAVLKK